MTKELQLLPYLTFDGACRQAMEFYKETFGGELIINTFGALYEGMPEADQQKVMHAALDNDFMSLFASDTVPGSTTTFGDNMRVTLTGTDSAKLATFFEKLAAGGSVMMPFEKQVWGQELGMLTDKFGTHWMVSVRA
ncbi:MAG: VOC family protein [Anaerolineales bacterium]|nr:VOC family protein [Anaerolineales bacterium]